MAESAIRWRGHTAFRHARLDRRSSLPSSLYVFTNSLTRFVVSFCHPRPRSGIQGLGGVIWKDAGRHPSAPLRAGCWSSPTGSWCLCVGAGLGARHSFLFSCGVSPPRDVGKRIVGFRPHTTRSFCFGKRAQNQWRPGVAPKRGFLCPGPWCVGCGTRCAQTVLAPIWNGRDRGTAPPAGAKTTAKGQDTGSSRLPCLS